ncbi:similar to inositol-pentakisphosphate 2-kinase [Botrytis cinerea T4]|uniref:Inositol-pentakisphosphate 2-kinase n=1 Tax=Botryotinia fuckeliana (strain T4) TaxID=999810 RepID=G2YV22_BOTF4|nr:similar to inositol-pentakisphosphate 2-kinase [Botrytis cinerea T4]
MNPLSAQPYRLPTSRISIKVLAEGAANVIYQITLDPGSQDLAEVNKGHQELEFLSGKLLRLRKDVPTTAPTSDSHQQWLGYILPLFNAEQLVTQELVYIGHLNVIPGLNTDLRRFDNPGGTSTSNHLAPPKGKFYRSRAQSGTFLAKDDYGLLVTDMTPRKSAHETVVEFKPKWLSPSHEMPSKAIRCRTCALHARRIAFGEERKNTDLQSYLCPLKLTDDDPKLKFANYEASASHILHKPRESPAVQSLAKWIHENPLLKRLRDLQTEYDGKASLKPEKASHELCVAMTLRDCSLYIRMDRNFQVVEARLGDLDYKSARKYSSWRKKEQELVEEGWYCGDEKREWKQPIDECLLSRKI